MRPHRALLLLIAGIVAIGVGSAPASTWGHPRPSLAPGSARPAPMPDSTLSWTSAQPVVPGSLFLALATAALASALIPCRRRVRDLRPTALALLVVFAGYEGATHSVHHLGDPASADRCFIAASAEHVGAAGGAGPPIAISIAPAPEPAPLAPPVIVRGAGLAPVAGRSPPA